MFYIDFLGDSTVPVGDVQGNWSNFDTQENDIGLNDLVVEASRIYPFWVDPLYTGISLSPLGVNWVNNNGRHSEGFETEYKTNFSASGINKGSNAVMNFSQTASSVNSWSSAAEVVAKGGERMMFATGINSISVARRNISKIGLRNAGRFAGGMGYGAGLVSVGLNGYRYYEGNISGTQFGVSTGITTASMIASFTLGPEAGVVVELGGQGIIIYTKAMQHDPVIRRATIQWATGPWMK